MWINRSHPVGPQIDTHIITAVNVIDVYVMSVTFVWFPNTSVPFPCSGALQKSNVSLGRRAIRLGLGWVRDSPKGMCAFAILFLKEEAVIIF